MSGNVDKKLLTAVLDLQARASKGDPKAKEDLARITADPKAVLRIKAAAARVRKAAEFASALSALPEAVQGDEGEEIEVVYGADEVDTADHVHSKMPFGSDSLDFKAALFKHRMSTLGAQAPFRRDNPPSILSGGSSLGNYQIVSSGEDPKDVANWAGEDAETTCVSCTFAPVEYLTQVSGSTSFRPFGTVRFGNRGFSAFAEVDVGLGVQFTVSASQVRLQVGMDPVSAALTIPGTMKLTGMVSGFKPIVRTAPITRTRYIDDVTGGTSVTVSIPPFSKEVWVYRTTTSAAMTVVVLDEATTPIYSVALAGGVVSLDPIMLSNDAVYVQVVAPGAAGAGDLGHVRCIFGLTL